MTNQGEGPTSHAAERERVQGQGRVARRVAPSRPPRRPGAALLVLLALGGCVDLTQPSVEDLCGDAGRPCRLDAGKPEVGVDLAPLPDLAGSPDGRDGPTPGDVDEPDDVLPPGDLPPDDDLTTPVDAGPDGPAPDTAGPDGSTPEALPPDVAPPDLPRDLPPDLPPDLPVDLPVDLPPDVTMVEAPAPPNKGVCPTGDNALLLCLRFEGSLADESPPAANVSGNVSYEAGVADLAARVGPASVIRASAGWGTVGNTFTLEAWVRPDRLPTGGQRMGVMDEETRFGMFILSGGTLACSSAGETVTVPGAVRVGQWSAVTCTTSANTIAAWVDGVQRNQGVLNGNPAGTANLAIGSNNPSGDAFEGLMDNVRVWNTVRTGPQICQASFGCP